MFIVLLRAMLCQCTGLQARAELQLGRTADAEASQRKALGFVDPADAPLQHLLQWMLMKKRISSGPGKLCKECCCLPQIQASISFR